MYDKNLKVYFINIKSPQDYDATASTSNQHWGRFQEHGPENSYIYPSDNEDEYYNDGPNHCNSNHYGDCFQDRRFDKDHKYAGHGASHSFTGNDSNFSPRSFTGIERFAPDRMQASSQEQFGHPPTLSFRSNDCYTLSSPDNFTDMAGWKQGNKAYSRSGEGYGRPIVVLSGLTDKVPMHIKQNIISHRYVDMKELIELNKPASEESCRLSVQIGN